MRGAWPLGVVLVVIGTPSGPLFFSFFPGKFALPYKFPRTLPLSKFPLFNPGIFPWQISEGLRIYHFQIRKPCEVANLLPYYLSSFTNSCLDYWNPLEIPNHLLANSTLTLSLPQPGRLNLSIGNPCPCHDVLGGRGWVRDSPSTRGDG